MAGDALAQAGGVDPLVGLAVSVLILVAGGLAVVHKMAVVRSFGKRNSPRSPDAMTNCPACGARIPQNDDPCEYCGQSAAERT